MNLYITLYIGSILVYLIFISFQYLTKLLNRRTLPVGYGYHTHTIGIVFAPLMLITIFISYGIKILGKVKKDVPKTTESMEEYQGVKLTKPK